MTHTTLQICEPREIDEYTCGVPVSSSLSPMAKSIWVMKNTPILSNHIDWFISILIIIWVIIVINKLCCLMTIYWSPNNDVFNGSLDHDTANLWKKTETRFQNILFQHINSRQSHSLCIEDPQRPCDQSAHGRHFSCTPATLFLEYVVFLLEMSCRVNIKKHDQLTFCHINL